MSRIHVLFCLAFLLGFSFPAQAEQTPLSRDRSITVLACASLMPVLTEMARRYAQEEDISVSLAFGAPVDLAQAIANGEVADIYISEHPLTMRDLKRQGLIDVFSLTTLAKNRLVMAIPKESYLTRTLPETAEFASILPDLPEKTTLAVADPATTHIGYTTQRILTELGQWERLSPMMERTRDAQHTRYRIAQGQQAGILYATDILAHPEGQIYLEIPPSLYEPIVYQAAVVAGDQMSEARNFLAFLKSPEAARYFSRHGFTR